MASFSLDGAGIHDQSNERISVCLGVRLKGMAREALSHGYAAFVVLVMGAGVRWEGGGGLGVGGLRPPFWLLLYPRALITTPA